MITINSEFNGETKALIRDFCAKCERNGLNRTMRRGYTFHYKNTRMDTYPDETVFFSYCDPSERVVATFCSVTYHNLERGHSPMELSVQVAFYVEDVGNVRKMVSTKFKVEDFLNCDIHGIIRHFNEVQQKADEYVKIKKEYQKLKSSNTLKSIVKKSILRSVP